MTEEISSKKPKSKIIKPLTIQLMFLALLIISLILAASLFFIWKECNQSQQKLRNDFLKQKQQILDQEKSLVSQIELFKDKTDQQSLQLDKLDTKIALLNAPMTKQQLWRQLSQVQFQMYLANQYLSAGMINLPIAEKFYESAKESLLALNLPEADALTSEFEELDQAFSNLNANSFAQVNQQLQSLSSLTDQLNKSLNADKASLKPKSNAKPSPVVVSWYQNLWNSIKLYSQELVVIRKRNEIIPPTVQEVKLLTSEMKFDILQAKWALLQQDVTLYQQSLHHYRSLLSQFPEQPLISQLSRQAKQLADKNIEPKLPTLQPLLDKVQQLIVAVEQKPSTPSPSSVNRNDLPLTTPKKNASPVNNKNTKANNPAVEI